MRYLVRSLAYVAALLCCTLTTPDIHAEFMFGGYTPYSGTGADSLHKIDYGAVGFNAIEALVAPPGTAAIGIDGYASHGWRVWGVPLLSDPQFGWIYETGREARLIHWEAEDTGSVVNWYGITTRYNHWGSTENDCWYVDPADTSHHADTIVWEIFDYYQALAERYTALFYMKIDTVGTSTDTVARIDFITPLPSGDSTFETKTFIAGDFLSDDSLFAHQVEYDVTWFDTSGLPYQGPLRSHIQINWMGNRKLSMDSLVIFNTAGAELARDTGSARLDSIFAQAEDYDATYLPVVFPLQTSPI